MPRSDPVPNQLPTASAPAPSVMNGMTQTWAMGPMRKAVMGDAADSIICGEPEDAALLFEGDDALDDRLLGGLDDRDQRGVDDEPDREEHDRGADREQDADRPERDVGQQQCPRRVRPESLRATKTPPAMNPKLTAPRTRPHVSTDTRVRP